MIKEYYICSCHKEGGIYRLGIENGKFFRIDETEADKPMYMFAEDNRMYVLLKDCFEGESGLSVFEIKEDGSLCEKETIPTKGVEACHLCADGEYIYCVNYMSGNLVSLPDGRVSVHSGKGINEKRQDMAHTHYVSLSPDGKYLMVTDLGTDKIYIYNKDMTVRSTVDLPGGYGPRHLAFHNDGKTVFCMNELVPSVSVLGYDDGELTLRETVLSIPLNCKAECFGSAIRCKGNTVYAANRGDDSVAVMEYKAGKLKLIKTVSTYGSYPRDFIEDDGYLICTNERGNNVTVVSVESGKLIDEIEMKTPIAVLRRKI